MDWIAYKTAAQECVKKYKYVVVIILAGILMMTLPVHEKTAAVVPQEQEENRDLEMALTQILSRVSGAGKVDVLLSEFRGKQTIYQQDERNSENNQNADTVLVTDAQRNESGLIKQINPPVYQGAIVLCQGADSSSVQLAIVQAVSDVTGLTSDRITILKMK